MREGRGLKLRQCFDGINDPLERFHGFVFDQIKLLDKVVEVLKRGVDVSLCFSLENLIPVDVVYMSKNTEKPCQDFLAGWNQCLGVHLAVLDEYGRIIQHIKAPRCKIIDVVWSRKSLRRFFLALSSGHWPAVLNARSTRHDRTLLRRAELTDHSITQHHCVV